MTTSTLTPNIVPSDPAEQGSGTRASTSDDRLSRPLLDLVVPVYNEEVDLEPSIRRLRDYLDRQFVLPAVITIADNASVDGTWAIAERLAASVPGIRAMHLDQKGRGRALKRAWLASEAPIVAYTDVDLSTDLDALLPLVAPLLSGHSQLAIGSRLARGAHVTRGPKREFISRSYNLILRTVLRAGFRDAQCGFKAIRTDAARLLLPFVEDRGWFFDTELLVLAERAGMRILEVPVDWVDDPDSRVAIVATATADLRGVARLLRERRPIPGTPRAGGWPRVELQPLVELRPPVELRPLAGLASHAGPNAQVAASISPGGQAG